MDAIVDQLSGLVWSPALIFLLLGAGLFFSILTRFVQVRLFKEMIRLLRTGGSSEQGISTFQALAVSLSGRVGTGNIAGVGAAIGFGGPGAVFWMWMVAFLGASTAYVESAMGQIYKEVDEGEYRGGPAFYFEKALGQKWFGWLFALTTIVAVGLLLPGVQSNSMANAAEVAFGQGAINNLGFVEVGTTKLLTAVVVVALLGFIIFGGVKRIAHVTQVVVPFMAIAYILLSLIVIVMNITELPGVFMLIIDDAFTPMAGLGAVIGWGVKRGVYSNEAGQGTGPHAAAAAEVEHPAQQGLVQAFSVYVDTLFVCSATAFMILITGAYNVHDASGGFLIQHLPTELAANSPAFTQMALEREFSGVGKVFVTTALFFFAFTTLLAYYYIAETNVAYLRRTFRFPGELIVLKFGLMGMVFYGAVKTADLAWSLGDIGVGFMAWLNIVGILIIYFTGGPALKVLKDYEQQLQAGARTFRFDPVALGIKGADFWEQRAKR